MTTENVMPDDGQPTGARVLMQLIEKERQQHREEAAMLRRAVELADWIPFAKGLLLGVLAGAGGVTIAWVVS